LYADCFGQFATHNRWCSFARRRFLWERWLAWHPSASVASGRCLVHADIPGRRDILPGIAARPTCCTR